MHDKDRLLFNITTEQLGYLYLVNESPKPLSNNVPKYNFLFPQEKVSNLTKPHQEIKIPNQDKAIQFGRAKGTEKFWIIWSTQQIPELELANSIFN